MIGDKIDLSKVNWSTIDQIIALILPDIKKKAQRYVLSIAGESGSGKSVIAVAVAEKLGGLGIHSEIIQQDDYFFYPPYSNDRRRREDISRVGITEVNLELLNQNLFDAIQGKQEIEKPLVNYRKNQISLEKLSLKDVRVILVEGTYVSLLKNVDRRIFIDRNYQDTRDDRWARKRDETDAFIEEVLEIEHKIISQHIYFADIIITSDFKLKLNVTTHRRGS